MLNDNKEGSMSLPLLLGQVRRGEFDGQPAVYKLYDLHVDLDTEQNSITEFIDELAGYTIAQHQWVSLCFATSEDMLPKNWLYQDLFCYCISLAHRTKA